MYVVSNCLLGANCKYSGGNNKNEDVLRFLEDHEYIVVCPETAGGLKAPRDPAERQGDKVIDKSGKDVTENFEKGAEICLKYVLSEADVSEIEGAILKANSPSCGCGVIYDGTFTGTKIEGYGVFAEKLKREGVKLATEKDFLNIFTL